MTTPFTLDRRDLMANIAMLLGAVAIPAEAFAAPKGKHAASKRFFAPAQIALVSALADTLIPVTDTPGAVAAGVPGKLDMLMANWASPQTQNMIVDALAHIDKLAIETDHKTFAQLSPARRKELLIAHDKAALKPVPRKEKLSGLAALIGAANSVVDPGYSRIKDLIIGLYYCSEVAMTQEIIYEHVPGKFVPSLKITKDSRPFSGLGTLIG